MLLCLLPLSLILALWLFVFSPKFGGPASSTPLPRQPLFAAAAERDDGRDGNSSNNSWHQYVRAPASRTVRPRAVLDRYSRGNVTNVAGLVDGQAPTYLSRAYGSDDVPTIVVDFGQNIVGLLTVEFAGSQNFSAGFPGLKLIFSETLEYLGNKSDYSRSYYGGSSAITNETDQIAVKPDPYTWTDQYGCEYGNQVCSDGLHGFRYVKIELDALSQDSPYTSPSGEVAISSLHVQFSGYLGTPDTFTGHFECSDENLTQWWYDGAYTTEMCTDVFRPNDTETRDAASPSLIGKLVIHDGAKRDRDPYMGDLAVSALTSYLTHDVEEAARNVMEDVVQHQDSTGWIPPASINNYTLQLFDYPLWWVSCSWEYVQYTGNLSYMEAYYPNLQAVLDDYYAQHTNSNNSLLLRPDGYGDYAFISRPGSAAYYSALYVLALNRAADLAGLLSHDADADRWRARAENVSRSFVDVLWDPAAEAFFDRKCSGAGCDAHAQDGNSLAILAGIVAANSSRANASLAYLDKNMRYKHGNAFYDAAGADIGGVDAGRVYAFVSYFEMAARFTAAGGAAGALEQIRRTYGWMAGREPGTATFWEGVGADGRPYEQGFTSMAHGWSTCIVPLMTNYVLGVQPTKPGFREWAVKPMPGDLTWARGEVPTPLQQGIRVRWERDAAADTFRVWVAAPEGTNGTVSVPYAAGGRVEVDGEVVYDAGRGVAKMGAMLRDGYVGVRIEGGGEHVVGFNGTASSAEADGRWEALAVRDGLLHGSAGASQAHSAHEGSSSDENGHHGDDGSGAYDDENDKKDNFIADQDGDGDIDAEDYYYGDANADGKVTKADAKYDGFGDGNDDGDVT